MMSLMLTLELNGVLVYKWLCPVSDYDELFHLFRHRAFTKSFFNIFFFPADLFSLE